MKQNLTNSTNSLKFINLIILTLILSSCDDNKSHFTVTADTIIKPGSELSKYVTQEEIDSFGFRYWDIDTYKVENNSTMENLRQLLKAKNTTNILNFIKDNNLSVDTPLHYGVTPLMYASFYDDEKTIKELIRLGADTNATDKYKLNALAYAIENNSTKAVKTLLDNGAYLDLLNLSLQYYQESPSYSIGLDGIIIDGDDMILSYEHKYGGKSKHGFHDGSSVYGYVISHNFIEIMQILLERGYIHPTGKMSDCSPKEEFKCSFYNILDNIPNHEPMLNLLLEHNISGQPSKEFLKSKYDECYKSYEWHKKIKERYQEEQRKVYFNLRFVLTKSVCSDKNGTFNNIKDYIYYKNRRNLTDGIVGIIDSGDKVIFKNPTDTIYNEINTINGKNFIE